MERVPVTDTTTAPYDAFADRTAEHTLTAACMTRGCPNIGRWAVTGAKDHDDLSVRAAAVARAEGWAAAVLRHPTGCLVLNVWCPGTEPTDEMLAAELRDVAEQAARVLAEGVTRAVFTYSDHAALLQARATALAGIAAMPPPTQYV